MAPVTVLAASGSLNRALTLAPTRTPARRSTASWTARSAAVVSGPGGWALKTTSTQSLELFQLSVGKPEAPYRYTPFPPSVPSARAVSTPFVTAEVK